MTWEKAGIEEYEGARVIADASDPVQAPWAVLEMFEQPEDDDLTRVGAWVRHDVYASLVGGARSVLVFSGWPRGWFRGLRGLPGRLPGGRA